MSKEIRLSPSECESSIHIQGAIDEVAGTGGRVVLPEMDLTLDRGLELHSGMELVGQGAGTILRKGPGKVYPLSGYHNYGMRDVPLLSTEGLKPGMTVSVLDDKRRGFYSTFGRITWIDDNWVGLDHGIEADYIADSNPRLTTAYPVVFGHDIRDAALRRLTIDGNKAANDAAMDGCRGGAIYFVRSHNIEVSDVEEHDFNGEGISFQMCSHLRILGSSFTGNTGNGLHPGAGSTDVLFESCRGERNSACGFFFCVRANHVTVKACAFIGNAREGVSIGTRDCFNLIMGCRIEGNGGPGVLARETAAPTEVHSCAVKWCRILGNALQYGQGQIAMVSDAHDLAILINHIASSASRPTPGVFAAETTRNIYLDGNRFEACTPETVGTTFVDKALDFDCGSGATEPRDYRHLLG